MSDRRCVVCTQRITDTGWVPVCCEVCWDSMDAADRRLIDRLHPRLSPADTVLAAILEQAFVDELVALPPDDWKPTGILNTPGITPYLPKDPPC